MRPRLAIACSPWHSPSNAHAYRLYVVKELRLSAPLTCHQRSPRLCRSDRSSVKHPSRDFLRTRCRPHGTIAAGPRTRRRPRPRPGIHAAACRCAGCAKRKWSASRRPERGATLDAHPHQLNALPHAVHLLRAARLARSTKPFVACGGCTRERCSDCRLVLSHCLCAVRPLLPTRAGVCLLMSDLEPLKPSNTGWLVADAIDGTFAFGWARTERPRTARAAGGPTVAALRGVPC